MYFIKRGEVLVLQESDSLENAKKWADENVLYTTRDIVILNDAKQVVSFRKWNLVGVKKPMPQIPNIIILCDGYYGPWQNNMEVQ